MLNLGAFDALRPGSRPSLVEFHEPSSVLHHRPRPAARPGTETGGAELSQRGLGGGAARWRRRRLPGAGQPVRGVRRTGRHLWRGRGGEIRRRPCRSASATANSRPRWRSSKAAASCHYAARTSDPVPRAVENNRYVSGMLDRRSVGRRQCWLRPQRLQKPHRLAGDGVTSSPCHITRLAAHKGADRPAGDARRRHRASSRRARRPICW